MALAIKRKPGTVKPFFNKDTSKSIKPNGAEKATPNTSPTKNDDVDQVDYKRITQDAKCSSACSAMPENQPIDQDKGIRSNASRMSSRENYIKRRRNHHDSHNAPYTNPSNTAQELMGEIDPEDTELKYSQVVTKQTRDSGGSLSPDSISFVGQPSLNRDLKAANSTRYMFVDQQQVTKTAVARVVNIRQHELRKSGYRDLKHWRENPDNMYIGRDMSVYVPGANGTKWGNPFKSKKLGREECCRLYNEHIRNTPELLNALGELVGKNLGCWCHPQACHGHELVKLIEQYHCVR